jgi:hypothetical protein
LGQDGLFKHITVSFDADLVAIDLDVVDQRLAAEITQHNRETPRLCRGGSKGLTFTAVAHRRDFRS